MSVIDMHDFDIRASEAWKLDGATGCSVAACRPHNLTWRWRTDAARDRAYAFFEEVVGAFTGLDPTTARYPERTIEEMLDLIDKGTTHTRYGVDLVEQTDGFKARVTDYAAIKARFIEHRVEDVFGLPFDEVKDTDEARTVIMMLQTGDLQAVKNAYEYVDAVWRK